MTIDMKIIFNYYSEELTVVMSIVQAVHFYLLTACVRKWNRLTLIITTFHVTW